MCSLRAASQTQTMMKTSRDGRDIQKTGISAGGGQKSECLQWLPLKHAQTLKCVINSNVSTMKYFNNNLNA